MNRINTFEKLIAEFFGAPYAVATDCCTHAIELSLRLEHVKTATCPTNTYISVPFTLEKLGIKWSFENKKWRDYYYLGNTNIIDAAVHWKENSYIPGSLMCLSFQYKKHLSLGRGGAILTDSYNSYVALKKLSYDGRVPDIPWVDQDISSIGYHYYMTPETAQLGIEKLPDAINTEPRVWSYNDYPHLPSMFVFSTLGH